MTTGDPMGEKYYEVNPYAYCGNEPISRIDPDGTDWRVQTKYNRETNKIEYLMTVNAVLYNNSSNQNIDMEQLSTAITKQITNAYNISEKGFVSKMNFNLRVVNSLDEIGEREHIIKIVNQKQLGKTGKSTIARARTVSDLEIMIGERIVPDILEGTDNRTIAHELGHTGGLLHEIDKQNTRNLMMQKVILQSFNADYLNATKLNHNQIRTIRDNYIHNKLNKHSLDVLLDALK